ncbi:hypothetical protein [Lactiplantibacillus paraxiangfangensis]|uniref:hypothetical protein n=1 Tax=Lactiplantibacillus paraxiangfangensis TaxID=3076224 RepID=UPI0030C6CCA6
MTKYDHSSLRRTAVVGCGGGYSPEAVFRLAWKPKTQVFQVAPPRNLAQNAS